MSQSQGIIAIALCAILVFNQGCISLKKQEDFSALTKPVSYQVPVTESSEPEGILGKTKSAVVETGKLVGVGVMLIGIFVIENWHDDDDDDDDWGSSS